MDQITSGEAIEIYKKMLDLQSSNHNTAITILLGISALLLGVTWWWNWRGARQFLTNKIQEEFQNEKNIFESELDKLVKNESSRTYKVYETKISEIEMNVCRSIAINASTNKIRSAAVKWFIGALHNAIKLNSQRMIRTFVDCLIIEMEEVKKELTVRQKKR